MQQTLRRDTTLGEIVDAATELNWGDAMNELTLADLAKALLSGEARLRADAIDEDAEAVRAACDPKCLAQLTWL